MQTVSYQKARNEILALLAVWPLEYARLRQCCASDSQCLGILRNLLLKGTIIADALGAFRLNQ
jgi:hypothetical protein